MQLFDTRTGVVHLDQIRSLHRAMTLLEIDALALPPGRDFDFKNGYTARGVGYLPYAGRELYYSLKLHTGVLYAVSFGIRMEATAGPFEFDAAVQQAHVSFLREQLGKPTESIQDGLAVTYRYPWGTIGAYWDPKGGISSMHLNWA